LPSSQSAIAVYPDVRRLDVMCSKTGHDESDVALRGDHRVLCVDIALLDPVPGVGVHVAYDHKALGVTEIPQPAVRTAVEVDVRALKAVGIEVVEVQHTYNASPVSVAPGHQEPA
jgi:hypothetical protein